MKPPRELESKDTLGTINLMARLRAFMRQQKLTRGEMAEVLKTPLRTLDGWLDRGTTPPACLLPLMDLLESRSQIRTWLGVNTSASKREPRGRPFRRGNEWRFGDRRRDETRALVYLED